MSTSTLGGFESEERKILYNEYLFQRRVLFGITISIVFAAFFWTIAICTDHWIVVAGDKAIFIPISERFFLSSHTGLWRLCRYALTPAILANSSLPHLLSKLFATNATEVAALKKDIAQEAYIEEFLQNANNVTIANVTTIDNQLRQTLFAQWARGASDFPKTKAKYKSLLAGNVSAAAIAGPPLIITPPKNKKNTQIIVIPNNLTVIKDVLGITPVRVKLNESAEVHIILPESLRLALFDGWTRKASVLRVLGKFAKDMDLPAVIMNANGTRIVLRPPDPPAKGYQNSDYLYAKYENCKYHNFFPLTNETEYDPSIDEVLLGDTNDTFDEYNLNVHKQHLEMIQDLVRTQASFACIALLIMSMAFVFSMYTFLNPRYMFKRLAAGVHFISASICFVVLRIVSYAVQYEQGHMEYLFPKGAEYYYGYGVYMAWAVFAVNASACFLFLWYSKKKKGSKAPTEELAMADEPINMGR